MRDTQPGGLGDRVEHLRRKKRIGSIRIMRPNWSSGSRYGGYQALKRPYCQKLGILRFGG